MPCLACFEAQPKAWQDQVLPPALPAVALEAARGIEWWKHVGKDGLVLGIDRFGSSAPEKALVDEYGFTPAKVAGRIESWLAQR